MNDEDFRQFVDILKTFDTAMLVTRRGHELRSRPMWIAESTGDGRVWFVTSIDSAKLDELTEYPDVNVSMQGDAKFLSISGAARATRDRQKVDELWNEEYSGWFPKGRNDPTLVLLEIVPTYVEYWDRSGAEALSLIFTAAKGAVTGEEADDTKGEVHGKVDFPKSETEQTRQART